MSAWFGGLTRLPLEKPTECDGVTCSFCGKHLKGVGETQKYINEILKNQLYEFTPPEAECYYRKKGWPYYYCCRCYQDPDWQHREDKERKNKKEKEKTHQQIENAKKTALKNTKLLTDLKKKKEEKRAQAMVDQNIQQVQSLLRTTLPSKDIQPAQTDYSKGKWIAFIHEAGNTLGKGAVCKLLKGLCKYPELFSMLTLDQIKSFSSALGDLLVEWGHTNPSDVPIEMFHWIHVFLVEQYLEFNQFDLSAAEKVHVHDVLASMFTSVVNIRELIEVTSYAYQITDTLPTLENDESLCVADNVAAGFIHLLLSERFSETAVNEAPSPSEWPQVVCMVLVNILTEQPQEDRYDYRQALSKLVNGKIWKPMEVVDLLLSIQTYMKSDDSDLPTAMEQLISSQSGSTLSKSRASVIDILNEEGPRGLLQRFSVNIGVNENAEKDVEDLCSEMEENKWANTAVIKRAKNIAMSVFRKFQHISCGNYSCPQDLNFRKFTAYEDILSNEDILSDVLVHLGCAVKKCKDYWPRATQILSCILLSISNKTHGRLIQIATGEGKSCIIAMYAVVLALSGKNVDVITSSPLLAKRDCSEWLSFYDHCGFCVSHNVDADNDSERQKCYEANIVYGTVGSFAADILRQEFHLRQTRGSRDTEKSAVIADEVDFMLLDRGVQFTYLSDKSLGLRHLEPIFATIWAIVSQLIPIQIEGEICFADRPKPFLQVIKSALDQASSVRIQQILEEAKEEGVLEGNIQSLDEDISSEMLSMVDSEKMLKLFKIARHELHKGLEVYTMQQGSVPVKVISAEYESLRDECPISVIILEKGHCLEIGKNDRYLQAGIIAKIKETTSPESRSDAEIKVPVHLQEFVEDRIPVWVQSAFQAVHMTRDREYHIRDGQILPVDFGSTGVIEAKKKWGDGLQQFVELKHHLQISEISLVTNYMSNLAYFKRYENRLYGVTGTLGSKTDREFLEKQFHLDHCQVPTHKKIKHYEDTGRIFQDEAEWLSAITEEVRSEVQRVKWRKGARAALVICEDIISAEKVACELRGKVPGQLHVCTGKGTNELPELELSPGDVIVATNLAGRGTDIKVTDEVNMAGGLFVIVSFLPSNTRVEMQAFGRTGRKGQPGSSKLLVNFEQLPLVFRKNAESVQELKMIRELLAKDRLDIMLQSEIAVCSAKEELFKEYCNQLKGEAEIFKTMKKSDQELALQFLHDKWGLWLQMKSDDMGGSIQNLKTSLERMVHNAVESIYRKMSENIYETVCFGNNLMLDDKFEEARNIYNEAIEKDLTWASIALYNRAYCTIKLKEDNYKSSAISDLTKCLEQLKNYKEEIQITTNSVHCFSSQEVKKDNTDNESNLMKYLVMRHQILTLFENNVREALGVLESLQEKDDAEACSQDIMSLPHTGKDEERELAELWLHGLVSVYSVKKKPRFCWSALAVFFIGIVQVAAGIFLTAVSGGALAMVGKALIEEGVSDIYEGVKGMISGEFDWKEWGIGKAMSLTISLVTFGIGSFIKRGMTAVKGIVNRGKETVRQMKAPLSVFRSQAGTSALNNSMKAAFKAAGKEVVEQGIVEIANYGEDKAIELLMEAIEKEILASIQKDIGQSTVSGNISGSVDFVTEKTLKDNPRGIDDLNVCRKIRNLVKDAGTHIVNEYIASPEWQSYLEKLFIGVSDKLNAKHKGNKTFIALSKVTKIVKNVQGFTEAARQTKLLSTEFESKLDIYLKEAFNDGPATNCIAQDIAKQSKEMKEKYDNLKQEIADDLARILSASIKDIWHKNFVGKISSDIRKKFNNMLSGHMRKALGTDKTNDTLTASVTALHAASMPTDVIQSKKPTRDAVNKHKKMLSEGDEMASVMDVRILSEKLGKRIEILKEDEHGKPLIRVGTNRTDDVITVVYQKPTGERKYGHYNAVVNGKLIRVENEGNDCLFHAVSLARGGSQENVENDSRQLKNLAARELDENPEKWGHLITRTNQARTISGRLMMVGGVKTNVTKADIGKVLKYRTVGNRNNGEVQADHEPPCQAFKLALGTNPVNPLADKLRTICEWDGREIHNGELPSVIMWTCDHKYAVSTGNSHESKAAAQYVADSIVRGDVEEMFKGGILAGSVDFSKSAYAINGKKMHKPQLGYQAQSGTAYKDQNLDILEQWRDLLGPHAMSAQQYKNLESWVKQKQYKNVNDPTRKALLAKCKAAMP